jgi:N-acetylneuraminic acid mutarotase
MSAFSLKRSVFSVLSLLLLGVPALVAATPSARTEARMVYDPRTTHIILYGGLTAVDQATRLALDLSDTWEYTGGHWAQRFPFHNPGPRSGHVMVYDSTRGRIVLFGGQNGKVQLNDTWYYRDDDWTRIDTATNPPARLLAGAAYDSKRDRIVLFGGTQISEDLKTTTYLQDTWEFNGTDWTRRAETGPAVRKPSLVYDAAHDQVLMIGTNEKVETLMYSYDPSNGSWTQLKPTTLPCGNEAALTYDTRRDKVQITGGLCSGVGSNAATHEWDGTNWTKIELVSSAPTTTGSSVAYDASRGYTTLFGGAEGGVPTDVTYLYNDKVWLPAADATTPIQRSLPVFVTDPENNRILLYGGMNLGADLEDFWQYKDAMWSSINNDKTPAACENAAGAWDSDRKKLVVYCGFDSALYEWDGTTWASFTNFKEKDRPAIRRLPTMAYDAKLKKTVLYGGYDGNYRDDTWLWNGATWQRIKDKPAPARTNTMMWYDPKMQKTVLYGGIGRPNEEDRLVRYSDMWSFDGNGWTEMKPATTPGLRYGASVVVEPDSGNVLLFGGLRLDINGQTQTQVYANDLWEWDGGAQSWTKIEPTSTAVATARENAGFAWDPSRNQYVIYAGYAGQYLSDVWALDRTNGQNRWILRTTPVRRRRGASTPGGLPSTGYVVARPTDKQ